MGRHAGLCLTGVALILMCSSNLAAPLERPGSTGTLDNLLIDDSTWIAANDVLIFAGNTGILARDRTGTFGWDAGFFYPFTAVDDIINGINTKTVMYAAGVWVGGRVNDSIRISMSQYSSEYWPGPMINGSFDTNAVDDAGYRVYSLYADSLAGNPNQSYLNWPTDQGAPVDGDGNPAMRGDQLLWAVFNDANPDQHGVLGGDTDPLGIEIRQMIWGADNPDQTTAVFVQYTMLNHGSNVIDSCFVVFWTDPDLGWAGDDLIGCDSVDNIFYCYNGDAEDDLANGGYGMQPPAVGVKLLAGPLVPSPGDTAIFDRTLVPDYRNLDLYSVVTYPTGGDPAVVAESWNVVRGLNVNGTTKINPVSGLPSRMWMTGDPVGGTGWLDTAPADRVMMAAVGPFTFNPGDSQFVLLKIAVGQGTNHLSSITDLRAVLNNPAGTPTGVGDDPRVSLPLSASLEQNYPNPFNPSTVIRYTLPVQSDARLTVYNVLGQEVATLVDRNQPAGTHSVIWNGCDSRGMPVASGVYYYRLSTEAFSDARKMVLIR
ncbi:MAG: FlgD immunoglobulin-like domain containing protein [candidate division Zixibacteria bacterium]|nr:FlgD immunoglobulin-like domain containing protein [candidate division Zixibacteria bacterium]